MGGNKHSDELHLMAERLNNHDVVIGPAIRDLASVRHFYNGKTNEMNKNKHQKH